MVDQPLLTQARDRQSARKAFELFASVPKHTDVRRHLLRAIVRDNRLYIHVPLRGVPKVMAVYCQASDHFGQYVAIMLGVTGKRHMLHAICQDRLEPGYGITTVHTFLTDLVGAYDITPPNREPFDLEIARFAEAESELGVEGPTNIFGDPELRSIFHIAELDRTKALPPLTPHDLLQVDWIQQASNQLARLAARASEVAGTINDLERSAAEKISPEFLALASASTRSELVRRFCDFNDASVMSLVMRHAQLLAANAPEGLTQRLYDLSIAAFIAATWHICSMALFCWSKERLPNHSMTVRVASCLATSRTSRC